MKTLLLCLSLFLASGGASALEWEDLKGCYFTVKYNDNFLENSKDNYSVINLNENPLFFLDSNEGEFLVHSIVLYKGPDKLYHYQDIYIEDGANSRSYGVLINNFRSFVRYRFSPEKILYLTNELRAREIELDIYEVIAFNKYRHGSDVFIESGRFILERTECYGEIETEEILTKGLKLPLNLKL
ncbi:hypothetical protein A9Q84_06310 [Halobacteriovorax marinus]|uniref:Lipoprotein n=1 Tax=Halobacteriovorax marinus TaxID=97084 RepID=A0A1Y5F9D6_9BACT|nr:hypothetical protein A9Q84_06310 [Halobacteriovorax marinus]